ncbi:MAG: acyltransferase [Muribaculaceae bacterium]|nr:acyltransferase [Muribaculaceae bacterium]
MTSAANNGPDGKNHKRDTQLDIYRALMMIYIPCVVHVIFWINKADEPWRSIVLFEMPVIFYISGATMFITGKRRNILSTVKNRTKRIILPYYLYALITLLFVILISLFLPVRDEINRENLLKLATIQNNPFPFLPYIFHVWFIIPYLLVSCSFPIQKRLADKANRWIYMLILLTILYLLQPLWNYFDSSISGCIRYAIYYNFFFMAGYLFYRQTSLKSLAIVTAISGIILAISIFSDINSVGECVMQAHKFPPDMLFIYFGTFSICVLALIFGNFTIPQNRILRHWNKYGYTIYLWQNISFVSYVIIYRYSPLQHLSSYPILDFIIAGTSIFVLSTLTSLAISPIETYIIKSISKLFNLILNSKKISK